MKKGVILCGGKGTRLLPATKNQNKHLIPILNRPMILYPLDTLIKLGIEDILIVTGGNHIGGFSDFFGDGSEYGINLTYRAQKEAGGIAQALGLAEDFSHGEEIMAILGDNVYGEITITNFTKENAHIFLKVVPDPERFGVPSFGSDMNISAIEEKPTKPKSSYAVTGLYHYPNDVFDVIKTLKPSARGELEITDVNNFYIKNNRMGYNILTNFWSDCGVPDSLFLTTEWAYRQKKENEKTYE